MWIDLINGRMRLWRLALLAVLELPALFGVLCFVVGTSKEQFWCRGFGEDFVAFYTSGQLISSGNGAMVYDLAVQERVQQQILQAAGSTCAYLFMPMEYFSAALIPLLPLSILPLNIAFLIWSALSTILCGLALWRLSRATRIPTWLLWLWLLGSPFFYSGLLVGQVHAFLFLAMTEFVLALRSDRERAAGLWLSLLLIKPQFLPIFGLFLVWKRRWNVVFYALVGGSLFVVLSLALVGVDGLRAQLLLITSYGTEDYFTSFGATVMTNWRRLAVTVAGWLGLGFGEMALPIALLSVVTVLAALLPWRGWSWPSMSPWERDRALLGLAAAALLVGYDTHLHSDVLVIVPALLVISAAPPGVVVHRGQWGILALLVAPSLLLPTVALATGQLGLAFKVTSLGVILLLVVVLVMLAAFARAPSAMRRG